MIEWKISNAPVPYDEALAFMDRRVDDIHTGRAPECIWLLEHPSLYTAGSSAKDSDLLDTRFPVFKTGRGGQYTYHGPGQRVAYVILDLRRRQPKPDVRKYVCDLEQWIIDTLAVFGIKGERRVGRVGIWVDMAEGEKKIAAIGVRIRRWVTLHGIAINVNPDLSHFSGIVPCGLAHYGVTSMRDLGHDVSLQMLDKALQTNFENIWV